jgi:hypothetical protein
MTRLFAFVLLELETCCPPLLIGNLHEPAFGMQLGEIVDCFLEVWQIRLATKTSIPDTLGNRGASANLHQHCQKGQFPENY